MSDVISIRVSKRLKRELEELNINYADLVRAYLEEVVRREKLKRLLKRADEIRGGLAGAYAPSYQLVREDRDEAGR